MGEKPENADSKDTERSFSSSPLFPIGEKHDQFGENVKFNLNKMKNNNYECTLLKQGVLFKASFFFKYSHF